MHSLLKRQLKRHFGDAAGSLPAGLSEFLQSIDTAYQEFDADRVMLERSLDLSSSELLQANSEMRALFFALPDLFFRLDQNGKILDCKGGHHEEFSLDPEELIGKRIQDVPSAEASAVLCDAIERVRKTKAQVNVTYRLSSNGKEYHYEARLLPVLETQIIAIVRNITERKRAADEIAHQRSFLRQVIDLNPNLIFAKDREGRFTLVNQAVAEAYGTTVDALLGRTDADFNPISDQVEHFRSDDMEVLDYAVEKVIPEEMLVDSRGNERWLQTIKRPIIGQDGSVDQVLGVATDITQRKQAETALQEAEQRAIVDYEMLLDRLATLASDLGSARDLTTIFRALNSFAHASTPCDSILVSLYDAETDVQTVAFSASRGVERDVKSLPPIAMSNSPQSRAVLTRSVVIEPDFQGAVTGQGRVDIVLEEDPRMPKSSLAAPMSVMGRMVGAVEVRSVEPAAFKAEHGTAMRMAANLAANAIENVRLLELERSSAEQLRMAQKMEAVGRLAGGVAHDFNNILSVILGYCELIMLTAPPDGELRARLGEIETSAQRAASLTRQLLAFSRKQVLEAKVLDVNTVLQDLDKMLKRLIGEDVELSTLPGSGLWRVKVDRGQLEQILVNLIVNARDAMPRGGKLTIETSNQWLDEDLSRGKRRLRPGPYVMLAVCDTGTGMDPSIQERVFEPFFTTKEIGKGTGLGLATVYGIVKQSDGYIWVYSEVGKGTTFKIYLPRVDEDLQLPTNAGSLEHGRGTETVLVVEDERGLRNLIKLGLEEAGYTVLEAGNADEAEAWARKHGGSIELLLTDVVLPGTGGRDLVSQVERVRADFKVLYMSGYTDDAIVRHGVLEQKMAFLQKPFTVSTLCRKIRQVLDSEASHG